MGSMAVEPGLGAGDVVVAVTTLSFDISVLELWLALVVGAEVVVASRDQAADGRRLGELIAESQATVVQATPTTWSMLFDAGWGGAAGLKVLCGGEAMSRDLADRLTGAVGEVWNMFGPTETTIWSLVHRVTPGGVGSVPIGRPIANTTCRIVDPDGGLVPVGVVGELWIGGDGVAVGYRGRVELTGERFVTRDGQRWYRTGDLARWRADGVIEYVGRSDDQVKVRGHRIELGEIETVLRTHPGVCDAVVIAHGHDATATLAAYLIPVDLITAPTVAELRGYLTDRLPTVMIPNTFTLLDTFPLTPNNKIDRKAFPAPGDATPAATATYVEPRTPTEQLIAGIFADLLHLDRVGTTDNFFELGGHSLQATTLLARLQTTFGVELTLRAFFTDPTVAGTAAVAMAAPAGGLAPIPVVDRSGELVVSPAQERMLFMEQLSPGWALHNLPVAMRFVGEVDVERSEAALSEVVRRHEALRTAFVFTGGAVRQRVAPPGPVRVRVAELGDLDDDVLPRELRAVATEPFDLAADLKLRAVLIRLGRGENVLVLVVHHVAADGWSVGLLVGELVEVYAAGVEGRAPVLATCRCSTGMWRCGSGRGGTTRASRWARWGSGSRRWVAVCRCWTCRRIGPRPRCAAIKGVCTASRCLPTSWTASAPSAAVTG